MKLNQNANIQPASKTTAISITKHTIVSTLILVSIIFVFLKLDNIVFIKKFQTTLPGIFTSIAIAWISLDLIIKVYTTPFKRLGKIVLLSILVATTVCLMVGIIFIGLKVDELVHWQYGAIFSPLYSIALLMTLLYLFLTPALWNPRFMMMRFAISLLVVLLMVVIFLSLLTVHMMSSKIRIFIVILPLEIAMVAHLVASAIRISDGIHGLLGSIIALLSLVSLSLKEELKLKFSYLFFLIPCLLLIGLALHMSFYKANVQPLPKAQK